MIIILITITLIDYVQRETLLAVRDSISTMLATGQVNPDAFSYSNVQIASVQLIVFSSVIGASIILGLIASRITLRPMREALEMQRRFIASVAHELRTPLATLKTNTEVAKLDIPADSAMSETLEDNVEEIDHMSEILNNLLLFNRVDTLESVSFDEIDISSVIEVTLRQLAQFAEKKKVEIVYERTDIPHVYGNATALEQAFFNIIKNAINYTQIGGAVHIACTTITEREVMIEVSDNGIGISKKELRHIFEPFYRTGAGQEAGRGTGLGLAIVFEIVKLHGGKLGVKSTDGQGTTLQVTIPRRSRALLAKVTDHDVKVSYDFSKAKEG